jgi:hypothetical protein
LCPGARENFGCESDDGCGIDAGVGTRDTNGVVNFGTFMIKYSFVVKTIRPAVTAMAIAFATGCTNPFAGDCVAIGVFGITATVVDAATNRAPIATPVLFISEGTYTEEHATPFARSDPPMYAGASERPGTYRVVVRATGYQDYVREGVRVTRGGHCNALSGVRLSVELVRAG